MADFKNEKQEMINQLTKKHKENGKLVSRVLVGSKFYKEFVFGAQTSEYENIPRDVKTMTIFKTRYGKFVIKEDPNLDKDTFKIELVDDVVEEDEVENIEEE